MSAWDYIMPHRLLFNKSLRKISQELRDRIEAYQIEFNRRKEICIAELQQAEENKNKELEALKADLLQELSDDYQILEELQKNIVKYFDCFFYCGYLCQLEEIKNRQNDILHEDYIFLGSQIKIIDNEIVLLRERQNELTAFTRVDDIIHLATLTGYDLDFQPMDDAKLMLGKISNALEAYCGEDRVEKYALLRLKNIIQERSDYLPTINYISWIIQIKRQFKKQLSSRRSDVKKEQAVLRKEISSIKKEIRTLTDRLDLYAEKVRYYWAKPITYLNADICYAYKELKEEKAYLSNDASYLRGEKKRLIDKRRSAISEIKEKKSKRRDVGSELKSMKDAHSNDQWRWDRLQRERRDLSSDIDSLSSEIDRYSSRIESLNSELAAVNSLETTIAEKKDIRKQWNAKRIRIEKWIKRYDKDFRSGRLIAENDEMNIIANRLIEIQQIRENGVAEAQKVYDQEADEEKPRNSKPSAEELLEEKKLLLRREEIYQQRKEGGHESKS